MEFSRPEYWSGKLFPSPGDLPKTGIESRSSTLQADSLPTEPQGKPKNIGVGSLSLLQGIFPKQGLNPGLPHCRQILYQLSHKGSPRILEWVAYPFFRIFPTLSSGVSCIAGGFFTNWAIRELLPMQSFISGLFSFHYLLLDNPHLFEVTILLLHFLILHRVLNFAVRKNNSIQ